MDFTGIVRDAYDGLQKSISDATGLDCSGSPSLTQQSFADETDINTIMDRFERTGILPETGFEARFGDASLFPDFHAAMNMSVQAIESFEALPAKIRARFHNNPAEFLDFFGDANNEAEARTLGLLPALPAAPEASQPPEATPPTGDGQTAPAGGR